MKCWGPEGLVVGRATWDYGSPQGRARAPAARSPSLASSIHSSSTSGLRLSQRATPGIMKAFEHVTRLSSTSRFLFPDRDRRLTGLSGS